MDRMTAVLFGNICKINAEIEAMKAANISRLLNQKSLAYSDNSYKNKATDIEILLAEFETAGEVGQRNG